MRRQEESEFYVLFFCFSCEDVCVWILLDEIQSVFKQIIVLLSCLENEGRKEQFSQDNEHQLCSDQNPLKIFGPRCSNIGPRTVPMLRTFNGRMVQLSLSQLLRNN